MKEREKERERDSLHLFYVSKGKERDNLNWNVQSA